MADIATVALTNPGTGGVALRRADGSYVLAEQLGARPLEVGQRLVGHIDSIGVETLADEQSGEGFGLFIQAYDLGLEAVQAELG